MSIYLPESADISGLDASFFKKKKKPAPPVAAQAGSTVQPLVNYGWDDVPYGWDDVPGVAGKLMKSIKKAAPIRAVTAIDPYAQAKRVCGAKGGAWHVDTNKCTKRECKDVEVSVD